MAQRWIAMGTTKLTNHVLLVLEVGPKVIEMIKETTDQDGFLQEHAIGVPHDVPV